MALSLTSPSATTFVLQPPILDFSAVMPAMPTMMPTARRVPLSSNPNAVNSPLRPSGASKVKRSYATTQREDQYGQPPPLKKQMLENGAPRASRSPNQARTRPALQTRPRPKAPSAAAESTHHQKTQEKDRDLVSWQKQYRARFPKMVFYFDSVPDDVRARLVKPIVYLGAREEKFFSIEVTHVVTTRPLPPTKPSNHQAPEPAHSRHNATDDQPQTINPSLLDCSSESRRKMLLEMGNRRVHPQDDIVRPKPVRNNDVLYKARDMDKRIYSVEKLHRILDNLLEGDSYASKAYSREQSHEANLAKMLRKERLNGPSDRDPRAVTKELNYFRGPYIYVYDMDEKTKPIMVKEYPKVADKTNGEWPQFKTVSQGRCPFVDESTVDAKLQKRALEKKAAKEAASKVAATDRESTAKPNADSAVSRVIGKRSREEYADPLTETKNGGNAVVIGVQPDDPFNPPKDLNSKRFDFNSQRFFTGRLNTGRLVGGEPVASGVQPSNVTSAIQSQRISSNANAPGTKAGTSKEVYNLQKTVLQRAAPVVPSGLAASRPLASVQAINADGQSSRSTSAGLALGRAIPAVGEDEKAKKAPSNAEPPAQKSKKDMKPGYCENCGDKFDDFDDHVISRKHRKFAESLDNWAELDNLLTLLDRPRKYEVLEQDSDDDCVNDSVDDYDGQW